MASATFRLLTLIALLTAPLGMPAMAKASAPPASHGTMAGQGHCDEQPKPNDHHKATDQSCCAAMCVGVVVPAGAADLAQYQSDRGRPASDTDRRGYIGEIATPPPKLA